MGRIGLESTISDAAKSQLVLEICSMSTTPIACSHKHHFNNPVKSHFMDWYHLLGVAEDSGLELIKRRYHKLALQLHPDKNKHPKAEIAFKLVSEAYTCLSDNVRRRAFNLERWKYFCIECNRIPYSSGNSLANSQHSSKPKVQDPMNFSRSGRVVQGLKDMRDRFKEEIRVIENCLRVHSLSRRESPLFNPSNNLCQSEIKQKSQRETPIFEPSDYLFQGYPHLRSQIYKKPESFWHYQRGRSVQGRGKYHSPIFENGSSTGPFRGMLKSKSVCIHS
ncbi:pre-mRNA-splicing factor cwf23 [Durio zibethinus]|uniref:Pre-mRNA-splicing factor cwf23 n=1 Tax=Durio zibethinus TaxID=66656 RepID=A0A6P6A790_DURZI|nr:pre-mRNA-splicing factor cwf23 [Durio zibethinus]